MATKSYTGPSYSPQIPNLNPTTLKNSGTLDRVTEELRGLSLQAGPGIRITRNSGAGTTIELEPKEEYQYAPEDYISVSYDSVGEEFTVTVTNLPVYVMDGKTTGITYKPPHAYTVSQSLTFDKPAVSAVAVLGIAPFVASPGWATAKPSMVWSGSATASDTATTFYKRTNIGPGFFTIVTMLAAGTYSLSTLTDTGVPVVCASIAEETTVKANSATSVTVYNLYDPAAGYDVDLTASGWTNPITTTIILAKDDVDATCSLDIGTNAGNYDRSIPIGNIATDASGNYTRLELSFGKFSATLGWTGSQVFVDNAGTTHNVVVKNGLITNWTTS